MSHAVYLTDDVFGDVIDALWFCSDSCARTRKEYQGWNGCKENYSQPYCQNEICKEALSWYCEDEQVWYIGDTPRESGN
jgi:hypothetical protein